MRALSARLFTGVDPAEDDSVTFYDIYKNGVLIYSGTENPCEPAFWEARVSSKEEAQKRRDLFRAQYEGIYGGE